MADEPQVEPAPSPSTSDEHVDRAFRPGRVGPVKLRAERPAPVSEGKAARVGPEKLAASTPDPKDA